MAYLLRDHLRHALLFSVIVNLLTLAPTIYLLQVYDRVLSSRSLETLAMLALFTIITLAVMMAIEVARGRLLVNAGAALDQRLGRLALAAQLDARAHLKQSPHSQSLRDLTLLRNFLSGPAILAFLDAPWLLIYLLIIFLFHWTLGALALLSALVLLLLAAVNNSHTKAQVHDYNQQQRQVDGFTGQLIRNAEVVTVLGMQTRLLNAWDTLKLDSLHKQTEVSDFGGFYKSLTKCIRQLIQVAMMAVGAWLVIEQHATAGVMIATTVLLGKALMPVEQMIGSWKQFAEVRDAWPRLAKLLDGDTKPVQVMLPPPTGAMLVQNISFAPNPKAKPILHNVGFQLNVGDMLAILGPSACGKSTLVRVLTGLWQPQAGTVRLDGADIGQWPREALGQHIGYVPQDVELFAGTVAENIARTNYLSFKKKRKNKAANAASPEARHDTETPSLDSEAIIRAAKRANVHDMILQLPKGYETEIGESGEILSGGQRQRIALARALYGDPRLVILDEPNASLDAMGEKLLRTTLEQLNHEQVTVIAVTHRASLIDVADKLLLMRDGRVERFGPRIEVERWMQSSRGSTVIPMSKSA